MLTLFNAFKMNGRQSLWFSLKTFSIFASMILSFILFAQNNRKGKIDEEMLLDSFILSKGYNSTILFSSSNIKQFWPEKNILCQDQSIVILLDEEHKSPFLKIQLANVSITQDCRIDIISKTSDLIFVVLNSEKEVISEALPDDKFIDYNVLSASFHLEKANNSSFFLRFSATKSSELEIKRIILSFSKNVSFLESPGTLCITEANSTTGVNDTKNKMSDDSFSVTGKMSRIYSSKKIIVTDNAISNSCKIKNIGDQPTNVYLGYAPITKDGKLINNRNNPYGSNIVMKIVSIDRKRKTITVDSEPKWKKGCFLVLNAREDLSDFPNHFFVEGTIQDVKKVDDHYYEILFDKSFQEDIAVGTHVRVQSPDGSTFLYTNSKLLQPGEEVSLSSTINKDDNYIQFGSKFCRGTAYVVPIVLSYSSDTSRENTVLISNFTVAY